MKSTAPVLQFEKVTVAGRSEGITSVTDVSLVVERGSIVIVLLEDGREQTLLAEAAQGLAAPEHGRVLFRGRSWQDMSDDEQSKERGRTRRVFDHYGWISNLDVAENICLSECHHTGRRTDDVLTEADVWCRRFGMARIPSGRPARVPSQTLRKLEWVRAFLGQPDLMILERPLFGVARGEAQLLGAAVREAVERGVACLWLSEDRPAADFGTVVKMSRYRMEGERVLPVAQEGEAVT